MGENETKQSQTQTLWVLYALLLGDFIPKSKLLLSLRNNVENPWNRNEYLYNQTSDLNSIPLLVYYLLLYH